MPLQSIEPRRLYRQVADQLCQLIDSGEFPAGSRLPTERELASQLDVSRPTVREALIALEVDGRIRIRVGSGIYVLASPAPVAMPIPPIAGPFEILAARALFEGAIAEQVAWIATPNELVAIDAALNRMKAATETGPESIAADRAFHIAVAAALANDAVTKVVGDLFDQRINPYYARLASYFENASSWHTASAEHQAIRDRIAARDPGGARAAMHAHLKQSQLRFTETFGDRPPEVALQTPARSDGGRPSPPQTQRQIAVNSGRKRP